MLRPRIIPSLLVQDGGLVKTIRFKDGKYVGDPINAVKIFNEKEADELAVFDIDATVTGREPDYRMIAHLAAECRMPLCYGGGVKTTEQAERIISLGVEKVAVSAAAVADPALLTEMSDRVGRQSVVAVLDIRRKSGLFRNKLEVVTHNATKAYAFDPLELALTFERAGAGEIVVNSVDRDGTSSGYDLDLAAEFRGELSVPLTMLGGASALDDVSDLIGRCGTIGAAAGSMFVFKGPRRAVLINYPASARKDEICADGMQRFAATASG